MKKIFLAAAMSVAFAGSAMAAQCPANIRQIDEALQKNPSLSGPQRAEITKLRNDGDKLHREGKHAESMAALARAKQMLGM